MKQVKVNYKEPCLFLIFFLLLFGCLGYEMGLVNLLNTIMNTAYALLMDTVFYHKLTRTLPSSIGGR